MVRAWAEKEMRNLNRLYAVGITCPRPRMLKGHVLLMEFVGDGFRPAPRLKDTRSEDVLRDLGPDGWSELYRDTCRLTWKMYRLAKLVHGDLSEYNILYHDKKVWFIDVSQSVDHDHPSAFDFLRKDLDNINQFFGAKGVNVATLRDFFDLVIDPEVTEKSIEAYLDAMAARCDARDRPGHILTDDEQVAEGVFKLITIAKNLHEVDTRHIYKHMDLAKKAAASGDANSKDADALYYRKVTGMNAQLTGANTESTLDAPAAKQEPAGRGADAADSAAVEGGEPTAAVRPALPRSWVVF